MASKLGWRCLKDSPIWDLGESWVMGRVSLLNVQRMRKKGSSLTYLKNICRETEDQLPGWSDDGNLEGEQFEDGHEHIICFLDS